MFNFDYITKEGIKEQNPKQPEVPFLNLINNGPNIDKTYLYAKDPKYQLLINKRENSWLKYFNDSKAFVEYSYDMDTIYKILKNTIQIKNEKC